MMRRFYVYEIIMSVVLVLSANIAVDAQVIYVNNSSVGSNNGSDWQNAFVDLENALDAAESGEEIWVATGKYVPGDISQGFTLKNGVSVYGGFEGFETELSERDWAANPTVLSGDVLEDDVDDDFSVNKEDNIHHVVTAGFLLDQTAVLDGFTIEGGNAASASDGSAGGGLLAQGAPTVMNILFTKNQGVNGGAVSLEGVNTSEIIFENCQLTRNSAVVSGGAMYIEGLGITPNVVNCEFSNNFALEAGGAIAINNSSPILTDLTFENNNSTIEGGAIWGQGFGVSSRMNLYNCDFITNQGVENGGAVSLTNSMRAGFDNCTFDQNISNLGGAIYTVGDSLGLFQSSFTGNMAEDGGAIYADFNFSLKFNESTFVGNVAEENGGACALYMSVAEIRKCTFKENDGYQGGGIYASDIETLIVNSLFLENTAYNGGGYFSDNENSANLIHCLVWKNEATNFGAAYAGFNTSSLFAANTIIWSNIGPDAEQTSFGPNSVLVIENSILQGESDPENINIAPIFVDEVNDNFIPVLVSPVVNAGETSDNVNNIPLDDFNGIPRDAIPDIGPFELVITPPNAPLNLTAEVQAPFKVILTWEDTNEDEEQYLVYRSAVDENGYAIIANLPPNATSYEDIGVSPDITYFYKVRARKLTNLFSEYSNTVEVYIPFEFPDKPDNLSIVEYTDVSVDLSWEDFSIDEISFVLERRDEPEGEYIEITDAIPPNSTNYQDTGLEPSTLYSYRIKARAISGDSEYSNAVAITTLEPSGLADVAWAELSVYPNPAVNLLNISFNPEFKAYEGQVLSLNGQVFQVFQVLGSAVQVDVEALPKGAYLVELNDGKTQVPLMFQKE